jgi:hypothetical protein
MRKKLKGLFALVLSVALVGTSFINAKAYSEDVTFDTVNIKLNYLDEELEGNYIAVSGTLKNDSAVVSNQEIAITKETFDAIVANSKERNTYTSSKLTEIDTKYESYKAKEKAKDEATEGTEAYNTALAEYNAAKAEYDALQEEFDSKVSEYNTKEKNLVPSFDNNKWKQLSLSSSTDTENRYDALPSGEYPYFVTWVKVTLDGKDYYNYDVNCLEEMEILICKIENGKYYDKNGKEVTEAEYNKSCNPVCKVSNGKYYDNNGKEVSKDAYTKACGNPKTGINMYYTYGAVTLIAAFGLYMVTRKVKKLSR